MIGWSKIVVRVVNLVFKYKLRRIPMRTLILFLAVTFAVPALADEPFKDAAKEKAKEAIKAQILDPLQEKIDRIIEVKTSIEDGKAKVAAAKEAIQKAIDDLKQQWADLKAKIVAEIKSAAKDKAAEKIAERIAEIQAKIDCIRECLAKLQGIKDSIDEIKAWVDATPDLPVGWSMVIFRTTEDGPKPVVVRPKAVTLPAVPVIEVVPAPMARRGWFRR
jgi:hypothetical protein